MNKVLAAVATTGLMCSAGMANVLWNNGPLVTDPGGMPDGSDASRIQSATGNTTLGGNANVGSFGRADNFTVGGPGWILDSVTAFGYETGSTTTSTMDGIFVQIWDANPTSGGNIIFGDKSTNRFESTDWTGAYRNSTNGPTGTTRPIMEVVGDLGGLVLAPGEYWIEVGLRTASGTTAWMPPVTIVDQGATGDALQFTVSSGVWTDWVDGGSQNALGMPFILTGQVVPAPGAAATLALAGLIGLRRRR
ncbi:MAG: hypothetical protein JJU33_08730 [Phycisphaerales bacterium]|nr:hypothetical protein [Phycisphaerales bacterium]